MRSAKASSWWALRAGGCGVIWIGGDDRGRKELGGWVVVGDCRGLARKGFDMTHARYFRTLRELLKSTGAHEAGGMAI